jgi:uncharacterized membrane protein YiaA
VLKLTGLDILFSAAGNLYLLLALVGVCIALWKGKTWLRKGIYAVLVLAAFSAPLVPEVTRQIEFRNRQATAKSMFEERCRTAGEKIYKTVENVEGIYLMKLRPSERNFGDQFKLDAPYTAKDFSIEILLLNRDASGSLTMNGTFSKGYSYIEAQDPKDGKRYRYTGSLKVVGQMKIDPENLQKALKINPNYDINNYVFVQDKVPALGSPPRYGVTYDDISTHEEREYWIAGSSLKVLDLETNEVIGERIGYMVDWAQGSGAGGRSPWLLAAANACPAFPRDPGGHPFTGYQVRDFVEKVLKPKK